jgi:M6 family metalloprotease-like protein
MSVARTLLPAIALVLHGAVAFAAQPATELQGGLELVWGDHAPGVEPGGDRLIGNLVMDDGQRIALDVDSARIAAGDLYALQGHRIAALASADVASGVVEAAEATLLHAETIVSADLAPMAVAANALTGSQPWVTLACKFSDNTAEPKNLAYFQTMLSNSPGRLDDYWRTVSYGKVNVVGSAAYGWFTLPHPRSYYVPAGGSADLNKLFADCTSAANATVDFSKFVGINQMFNADLDGYAWGGNRYATLDGKNASWPVTWEPPWGYQHEAPLAHEMGHGFGLPHSNNSDLDSDPYDNPWDVMSDSWHDATSDATFGTQPKHISTYQRDRLGWIDAARKLTIASAGTWANLSLDAAELASSTNLQMIVITLPGAVATHYYTIEARRAGVAGDAYDHNLAGSAVIVHEVDTTRTEPAWSVDAQMPPANVADDPGSMFVTGETWVAPGGAFSVSVTAVSANGFVVSVDRAADDLVFRSSF